MFSAYSVIIKTNERGTDMMLTQKNLVKKRFMDSMKSIINRRLVGK